MIGALIVQDQDRRADVHEDIYAHLVRGVSQAGLLPEASQCYFHCALEVDLLLSLEIAQMIWRTCTYYVAGRIHARERLSENGGTFCEGARVLLVRVQEAEGGLEIISLSRGDCG